MRIFGSTISAFRWTAQNRRACAALADIADHPVFQFVETSELSSAQEPNNGRQRCSGWPRARVVEQSTKSDRQKHKKLVWEIEQIFRLTTSNGGVLTGRGADFILIDDPLKPEETLSDAFRRLKSTGRAGSPSPRSRRELLCRSPQDHMKISLDMKGFVRRLDPPMPTFRLPAEQKPDVMLCIPSLPSGP